MKTFFTSLFEIRCQAAALLLALIALSVTDVQGQNTQVKLSVIPDRVGEADGVVTVMVKGTLTQTFQGTVGQVMLPAFASNTIIVTVSVTGGHGDRGHGLRVGLGLHADDR